MAAPLCACHRHPDAESRHPEPDAGYGRGIGPEVGTGPARVQFRLRDVLPESRAPAGVPVLRYLLL